MIKIDINKFSLKKVYLKKVNSTGYISYYNNIDEVRQKKHHSLKGSKNLYQRTKKLSNTKLTDFSYAPKQAYILMYENTPINIEYCLVSEYYKNSNNNLIKRNDDELQQLIKSWNEHKISSFNSFIKRLELNKEHTYFDSKYIIFTKKEIKEEKEDKEKDNEGIKNKKSIKKNKIYNKKSIDENGYFYTYSMEGISLVDFKFKSVKRKVLTYEIEVNEKKYITYFPSFTSIKIDDLDAFAKKYFINYNFPIDCAKYLSEHYDNEILDFLEIEKILIEMGTLNLFNIDYGIRSNNKYSDDVIICFSWLAGLINKSDNILQAQGIKNIFSNLLNKSKSGGYLTDVSLLEERQRMFKKGKPEKLKDIKNILDNSKKIKNKQEILKQFPHLSFKFSSEKEIVDLE